MFSGNQVKILFLVSVIFILVFTSTSFARKKIRFVSVSWTGVTIKTEIAVKIVKSLGYHGSNTIVSLPLAYGAMADDNADIFLGNWMPSMESIANPYFKDASVIKLIPNMEGAKYTLAAPSYVIKSGLRDFSDIVKFGEKLDWKIYGIEEGNDGNRIIQKMIDNNMFGLGKFDLVPSSEAGMLSQVESFADDNKWIVFLGWSPHYMNVTIDMGYLTGSTQETFGGDNGTALVYTNIRKGFKEECPNLLNFLKNYKFSISMMNEIMAELNRNQYLKPVDAGLRWIRNHPHVYRKWFEGVKTIDGKSGLEAFENYLEK